MIGIRLHWTNVIIVRVTVEFLVVLLGCFLIERPFSSRRRSSSFTVITGAVDDSRSTETTSTHKKASYAASLAAKYEPGCAKDTLIVLMHSCHSIWQGFVMLQQLD